MTRATKAVARHRAHKRLYKAAKGNWGRRSKNLRMVKETLMRAGKFAFRDRRAKKRNMRALWITRINAACRQRGIMYSRFVHMMDQAQIILNRKVLADLAVVDPQIFDKLLEVARVQKQSA